MVRKRVVRLPGFPAARIFMNQFKFTNRVGPLAVVLAVLVIPAAGQLQVIRQGDDSTGTRLAFERMGEAVAVGDFNGDGFGDLATGAPREKGPDNPLTSVGAVTVSRGNRFGIGWNGARELSPFDGGHLTDIHTHYRFGAALAAGDFDGDGYDDLAVGASFSSVQRVFVYRGSAAGLAGVPSVWEVADFGVAGSASGGFGRTLAAGDFNADGFDELVIGSPGHDGGNGALFVLRGSAGGLALPAAGAVIRTSALPGGLSAGCGFGSSLAVGNVLGFERPDLLVGAPLHDVAGKADVGALVGIPGVDSSSGLSAGASVVYLTSDVGLALRAGSRLGTAVTTGDFRGDGGHVDFAASMVFGQVGEGDSVIVWRGQIIPALERVIDSPLSSQAVGNFGAALAAGDVNGDGRDELVVGAPQAPGSNGGVALPNEGVVYLFNGSQGGPQPNGPTVVRASDFEDLPEGQLEFGMALAAGRTTSAARDSIFIGSPGKDSAAGEVVDYSPYRQPARPRCATAITVNCEGHITYALRMRDRVFIASTTKIMTVLLACEATALPMGHPQRRTLASEYTIEPWTLIGFPNVAGGCSRYNFVPGDVVTFEDLIHATIMPSGNDAAMCIADAMFGELSGSIWPGHLGVPQFVNRMNQRAAQIGMDDTNFTNPSGVDTGVPLSTAYDMYLLAREAMKNPMFADKIGTTTYQTAATTGDGNANRRTIVYNWLNNRLASNPSVLGLKPGGTPGAGATAVLAAPSVKPDGLAFAAGFGWRLPGINTQDILIQFAQDSCPKPPIKGPGNLTKKLNPTHAGPQVKVFSGQVHDLRVNEADGKLGFDLDFQAGASAAAEHLEAKMDYRVGVMIAPGESYEIEIEGLHGVGMIGIGNTGWQPAIAVDYQVDRPTGPVTARGVMIPTMEHVEIAPSAHNPLAPFRFSVGNAGAEEVFVALSFEGLDFRPRFGQRPPFRDRYRFTMNLDPVRQNFELAVVKPEGGESDLFFAIQGAGGDAVFQPEVRMLGINVGPGPVTAGGLALRLDWWAQTDYYPQFRVMHSLDLEDWTALETVGADRRDWEGTAPAGGRGFYRVEGVFPEN